MNMNTHTHIHIYIYIYIGVCVPVFANMCIDEMQTLTFNIEADSL